MKKITITQEFEIKLPDELHNCSQDELINSLHEMHDYYGRQIVTSMSVSPDYIQTTLVEIDNIEVLNEGMSIILGDS